MAMVILFGITYAKEIRACAETTSLRATIKKTLRHSKLPGKENSYQPEIRNGVTLARYVEPRTRTGSTCPGQCMLASAVIHGIIRRESGGTLNGKRLAHPRERNVLPGFA